MQQNWDWYISAAIESVAEEPKQEALSFVLREEPTACTVSVKTVEPSDVCWQRPQNKFIPGRRTFQD